MKKVADIFLVVVLLLATIGICASKSQTKPAYPNAPGTLVATNKEATIDYSNMTDGYVIVAIPQVKERIKVQVTCPNNVTYTYDIASNSSAILPLSEGNGTYKVTVYKNTTGSKYAALVSITQSVTLKDEFSPFLIPNQYVNFTEKSEVVSQAKKLTETTTDTLEKVKLVYEYVVNNFTYDKEKAKTVKSGYLPDVDAVLKAKKGICFDYAAVMTAMLRSQGVPCKLVIGYAGTAYHAWISVYSEELGWVNSAIYFDGSTWQRMDPTFASSGKQSEAIMKYIGDGSNYKTKYVY